MEQSVKQQIEVNILKDNNNKKNTRNYLDKKEMLRNYHLSMKAGRANEYMGRAFILLVKKIARKPGWNHYSWIDEMEGDGILALCIGWHKFNHTKSDEIFCYYTTIVYNAFRQRLNKENTKLLTRDEMLARAGLDVSSDYQDRLEKHKARMFKRSEGAKALRQKRLDEAGTAEGGKT